jgi:5-formyltetrahydrofolate cyclo-ligase
MNSSNDKAEIRREMKARRKALAADAKAAADAVVCEKLKTRGDIGFMLDPLDYGGVLAVYLASPDEINIDPYIEHMLHAGVEVVAPRWNGETYELAKLKGLDEKNLRRGPMGIREPIDADVVEPKSVYAWIIPGLAFTRGGKRLGYGGGWYDRFLASAPKGAVKIGVAYSFQVVEDLPAEPHDVMLSDVVDGSLYDEALEFKEMDDGFLAKITIKDRVQRFKTVGMCLLWTLVASAVGFAVLGLMYGLAKAGVFMPTRRSLFIVLLVILAGFVFSVSVLIKAIAACVECAAEICFSHGEGVCRRKLFGRLPLPARRFTLSPWSQATGGSCGSNLMDSDFGTVKIWSDGEYGTRCQPLIRTYASTAFMLAFQINRANKWNDVAYSDARRDRLANLPRGMKIRPADDGQGQVAVIRPFSPNISVDSVGGALVLLLLATFMLYIPCVGWVLGGVVALTTLTRCLYGILRGLFGCVKCEIKNGRMNCTSGFWPFVRECGVSLEGKSLRLGRELESLSDLFEEAGCNPFTWLPPKFRLPLRLFVEEAVAQNALRRDAMPTIARL